MANAELSSTSNDPLALFLNSVIERVSGIRCIALYDQDGILIKAVPQSEAPHHNFKPLATNFVCACDQLLKIGLGQNKSMTFCYDDKCIVQFWAFPLIVTIVAETSANLGLVSELEDRISEAMDPLRKQLL